MKEHNNKFGKLDVPSQMPQANLPLAGKGNGSKGPRSPLNGKPVDIDLAKAPNKAKGKGKK